MCALLPFFSKQHFFPVRLFLILNGNVLIPRLWFIQQKVMASRSHSRGYYGCLHLECSGVMCSFETTSGCFFVLFTIILCLLVSIRQIHFFHYCWKLFCLGIFLWQISHSVVIFENKKLDYPTIYAKSKNFSSKNLFKFMYCSWIVFLRFQKLH